jgi:hypothetical protein
VNVPRPPVPPRAAPSPPKAPAPPPTAAPSAPTGAAPPAKKKRIIIYRGSKMEVDD